MAGAIAAHAVILCAHLSEGRILADHGCRMFSFSGASLFNFMKSYTTLAL